MIIKATLKIDTDAIAEAGVRFDQALDLELADLRANLTRKYDVQQLAKAPEFEFQGHNADELKAIIDFAQLKGWAS